jgi:gliding motility-associated-like protein
MFSWQSRSSALASLVFIFCLSCIHLQALQAQCVGPVINTFPYNEGFEAGAAWTTGGVANDWAWGAPTHALINSAGGGARCWCVGGLSGQFYNIGEQSYIQSPCFDFTSLPYPWISLKIFWEDEYSYDGMQLESSTDGGLTWITVGSAADPVDCLNANWYDYKNIKYLNGGTINDGWTGGRIGAGPGCGGPGGGGFGSNGWVTAMHCLTGLAGKPSVMFRLAFGAGTTCNNYDGIAIDDIHIDNAPTSGSNFTYVCAGPNTVSFTNALACATSSSWNFGDPASGASNTSVLMNPSHTFSGPGTYTVTLTSTSSCSAPGISSVPVSILGASISPVNATCNGSNNGSATATASGSAGPYTYSWSPGGSASSSVSGLSPGTYSVTVTAAGGCPATSSVTITQPAAITVTAKPVPTSCSNNNGSISVTASGGTGAYTYSWSPSGGTGPSATNLATGTYTCSIKDANGCSGSVTAVVGSTSSAPTAGVSALGPLTFCTGGSVKLVASGTGTYSWSTGATADTITISTSGTYTVTVTNGCGSKSADTVVTVQTAPLALISGNPSFCSGDSTKLTASGGTSYSWNSGATTPSIEVSQPGTYTVTATNTCGSSTAQLTVVQNTVTASFISDSITGRAALTVNFTNNSIGGTTYSWSFGDGSSSALQNPTHIFTAGGTYTVLLTVTNGNGCVSTQSETIVVTNLISSIKVPNVFTPNGDGSNDVFLISSQGITQMDVKIYDRWGVQLADLSDPAQNWDGRTKTGTVVVNGTYYYVLSAKGQDGQSYNLKGFFMLLH